MMELWKHFESVLCLLLGGRSNTLCKGREATSGEAKSGGEGGPGEERGATADGSGNGGPDSNSPQAEDDDMSKGQCRSVRRGGAHRSPKSYL